MKKLLVLVLCACIYTISHAQSATPNKISGYVTDSVTNTPLGFATLTLFNGDNGKAIQSILSKDDGSFSFNVLLQGNYKLAISSVGYRQNSIVVNLIKGNPAGSLIIKLSPASKQLQGVTVNATKALVKQEIDRLSYNTQADPDSKALTVIEMLRKVPLVSVDGDDNIELQGSTNYRIFINGKPSQLLTSNAKDVLRTMPAVNIQKIEIITTPPAKYDSEGLAGIINIITTQKTADGYNGSIGARYSYPNGPSFNFNTNLKTGKFGLAVNGVFGHQSPVSISAGNSRQTSGVLSSDLLQYGTNITNSNTNYIGTEFSYEIDSLSLLTSSVNYNLGNFNQDFSRVSLFTDQTGFKQNYTSFNNGGYKLNGTDIGVNFQRGFKNNKNQFLTLSYLYSYFANKQHADVDFTQQLNFNQPNYTQLNNAGSHEQTVQLDYIQPSKKITVEAGLKAIFRNNFSDFETDNFSAANNNYVPQPAYSNNFHYHQNVYSAYNSYQLKIKTYTFKAGLRFEETHVDANFISAGNQLNTNYSNLVPSINILHVINSKSTLILGYTDRTARPSITQLNPFVDKSNIRFISFGNPDLRPVIRHLFELIYNRNGSGTFTTRLAYSFSNNTIESVSTLVSDTVSQTTYYNIGKLKNASIYSSFNYPLTPKLNIDANGQIAYIKLSGLNNGVVLGNSGVRTTFNASLAYKYSNSLRFGVNTNYNSPYIFLQGKGTNFFGSSFSATQNFFNNKLTATAILSNPYQKFRLYTSSTQSNDFYQTSFTNNYYRTFALAVNYKFGKLSKSIKKNSRGIYNDDVKNGG